MHPTGPMLAFQLNIPEIFSEALASPAYMVATPMNTGLVKCALWQLIAQFNEL